MTTPAPVAAAPTRKPAIIYPTLKDPRWFQVAFLLSYVMYAFSSPGFSRRPSQWLSGLATCLVLDVAVTYWNRRVILAPLSGFISSMGLLLLCDSPRAWPYALLAALVILSKQIIRINGKHIFNPVNFAVVCGLLFISNFVTVEAGRWGGSLVPMLAISALGCVVVWRAKRADVSFTYVIAFFVGVVIRHLITGTPLLTVAGPMTGAAFQLFTFFMISDPMTTPETSRGRVVYGVLLAALDNVLRYNQVEYAPFYALFAMSGVLPVYRALFAPAVAEQVWQTRSIGTEQTKVQAPKPRWRVVFDQALGPAVVVLIVGVGWQVRTARAAASYDEGASLTAEQLPFTMADAGGDTRVSFTHEMFVPHASLKNIGPYLSKMAGASVSVVDYDGDGFQDIFFTNAAVGSRNAMFRNQHDGTFTEVAASIGLADVNQAAGALRGLFFDADNDGDPDLLLQTTWCPKFFVNTGGQFAENTQSGFDHCNYGYASNVLDYDGDGYLDVLVGNFYKPVNLSDPTDTHFVWNSFVEANNGGPFHVYHNEGGTRFSRVADSLGITTTGFTHAIGVYDLRGTGRPDVYVASDFNTDTVFYNEGGGRFVRQPRVLKYHSNSMNAEIADIDGDGQPVVLTTQIYEPGHSPGNNDLWKFAPDGKISDVVRLKGLQRCGWAWGAKFIDLDHDTALDAIITNGFMTLNGPGEYWYKQGVMAGSSGAIVEDATKWPAVGSDSLAHREADCLYRNVNGVYQKVSPAPLDTERLDGRGIVALDVLNTGVPTLVVANVGQRAQVYRVTPPAANRWIGLSLTGTKSNRDAIGARVTVDLGDKTLVREVHPTNGYLSQHDRRLLVGIGPRDAVRSVTIRWPSGIEQRLDAPAVNRYHDVVEAAPAGGLLTQLR